MFKVGDIVKTKNGQALRILATDRPGFRDTEHNLYPIVAMGVTCGSIFYYRADGTVYGPAVSSVFDIVTKKPKIRQWLAARSQPFHSGGDPYLSILSEATLASRRADGSVLTAVEVIYDPNDNTFEFVYEFEDVVTEE